MHLTRPQKIEDLIISTLLTGEKKTVELLRLISRTQGFIGTTKQGFYRALRKLIKEEVVIVYKKHISLNSNWVQEMRDLFIRSTDQYSNPDSPIGFLSLSDGESASYTFNTIKNMDTFWGHTWNVLIKQITPDEPVFVYDPHYWFYIARKDLEKKYHKEISSQHRYFFMTVSAKTHLGTLIKNDFKPPYLQYNVKRVFNDESYYMTVLGDYIVETHLDKKIVDIISHIFNTNTAITTEVVRILQDLIETPISCKLKITRSLTKAEKLKKKLIKDFCIFNRTDSLSSSTQQNRPLYRR